MKKQRKPLQNGITLITLVITIIILLILAGVVINLSIGENGLFARAKEAEKLQKMAEIKEQLGTEILASQAEALARNEELEEAQVEDIISKYGELQEDKDTIILKDNGYEISLLEIYSGTTTTTGSYTESKAKIELLENQVATLQKMLEDSSKLEGEKAEELNELQQTLLSATVTQDKILEGYTAYIGGELKEGTMENYSGQTVSPGSTTSDDNYVYYSMPSSGYYDTSSKIRTTNTVSRTGGFGVSHHDYIELDVVGYSSLRITLTAGHPLGYGWSNGYFTVIADGNTIGTLKEFKTVTYNISQYKKIKLIMTYTGGNGNSVLGTYTIS